MNPIADESRDVDILDLRGMLAKVVERRWWVTASALFFAVAAAAVAFWSTPVYRASAILMPASTDPSGLNSTLTSALGALGGLADIASIGLGRNDAATVEALAVLQSREFTERFIGDKQLMPKLYASLWDSGKGEWGVPPEDRPTSAKSYKRFQKKIRSVSRDKKTGLVTLSINWTDPDEAAEWANELVSRLNVEMRERAIKSAEAALGYLEKELATTSTIDTRDAVSRLIETQIKQRMLANVTQEYAFRVVDRAMAPDSDDPIRPRKFLMVVSGLLTGLAFGMACAIFFTPRASIARH